MTKQSVTWACRVINRVYRWLTGKCAVSWDGFLFLSTCLHSGICSLALCCVLYCGCFENRNTSYFIYFIWFSLYHVGRKSDWMINYFYISVWFSLLVCAGKYSIFLVGVVWQILSCSSNPENLFSNCWNWSKKNKLFELQPRMCMISKIFKPSYLGEHSNIRPCALMCPTSTEVMAFELCTNNKLVNKAVTTGQFTASPQSIWNELTKGSCFVCGSGLYTVFLKIRTILINLHYVSPLLFTEW